MLSSRQRDSLRTRSFRRRRFPLATLRSIWPYSTAVSKIAASVAIILLMLEGARAPNPSEPRSGRLWVKGADDKDFLRFRAYPRIGIRATLWWRATDVTDQRVVVPCGRNGARGAHTEVSEVEEVVLPEQAAPFRA